jgi:hypothetical protein
MSAVLQTASYEQLQAMLAARRVTWQRLDIVNEQLGEWKFMCAIPNPTNPRMRRNYEARAVGPYGLAAIRAVIVEIDLASGQAAPPAVAPAAPPVGAAATAGWHH